MIHHVGSETLQEHLIGVVIKAVARLLTLECFVAKVRCLVVKQRCHGRRAGIPRPGMVCPRGARAGKRIMGMQYSGATVVA